LVKVWPSKSQTKLAHQSLPREKQQCETVFGKSALTWKLFATTLLLKLEASRKKRLLSRLVLRVCLKKTVFFLSARILLAFFYLKVFINEATIMEEKKKFGQESFVWTT
jgi:hypothetical protein